MVSTIPWYCGVYHWFGGECFIAVLARCTHAGSIQALLILRGTDGTDVEQWHTSQSRYDSMPLLDARSVSDPVWLLCLVHEVEISANSVFSLLRDIPSIFDSYCLQVKVHYHSNRAYSCSKWPGIVWREERRYTPQQRRSNVRWHCFVLRLPHPQLALHSCSLDPHHSLGMVCSLTIPHT